MDPNTRNQKDLLSILKPYPAEEMEASEATLPGRDASPF
jgi:hypothetical protein